MAYISGFIFDLTGNSGYENDWTNTPNTFDREYYDTLLDPPGGQQNGWEQVQVPGGKFQWKWGCNGGGGCRDLMLNVDMNLFYDLDEHFVGNDGQVELPDPLPNSAPQNLCNNPNRRFLV